MGTFGGGTWAGGTWAGGTFATGPGGVAPIVTAPDLGGGVTYEDLARAALSRLMEVTDTVPSSRRTMYRRLSLRQQWLYSLANRANHEYFGASATAPLVGGRLDLSRLVPEPAMLETVVLVRVADPGTSKLRVGQRVNVVPLSDICSGLAPRVTIRSLLLEQVDDELNGVRSLRIDYARRPPTVAVRDDGKSAIALPLPFQELLVIDLARELVKKAMKIDPGVRSAQIGLLDAEEEELLAEFLAHVRGFIAPLDDRFRMAEA